MKVLVTGSHGLVGTALLESLIANKYQVLRLVRARSTSGTDISWDPDAGNIDKEKLEGLDVVFHLAGESIASGRWNDDKKRRIRESRVRGTQLLANTLVQLTDRPTTLVSASAIGYYGDRSDEVLTERSRVGTGFLSEVCVEWEDATTPASAAGIRVVLARFGIILDKKGGALAKMLPPFRMGIGGRVGDGKQWMSWIALDDVIAGLQFVAENRGISGPVNFVAPNPVTNAQFTKSLGRILSRPTLFPIPAFGARLAFGEMADALLLSSQRVEPACLKNENYSFRFSELNKALQHILK
ncbi:MAG TPA: TIGR01777 family oxidoreductase [Pyrinomonadaceae bacterium]